MSIQRSFILGTFLRSSSVIRWIGFLPITPKTGPASVQTASRWPMSTWGSHPPTGTTYRYPSSSMCWTARPIWSQWPASITRTGAPGFFTAITLPCTSVRTSSANPPAYWRTTSWMGLS